MMGCHLGCHLDFHLKYWLNIKCECIISLAHRHEFWKWDFCCEGKMSPMGKCVCNGNERTHSLAHSLTHSTRARIESVM